MNEFSNLKRHKITDRLRSEVFDLTIIGGGITGAGIALDAASRGMKVALVEKGDFASGTSSKSTKLIHGGLRYLKQFDFWLVKEVGSERAVVHKLAPHLVSPEKMLLPLIENGQYGKWLTSIGLKVYDILASVEGDDKRQMLEKKEALRLEPLLPKKILKGAGYYAEYRTDDARLTLEIIKTALEQGAVPINYMEVKEFLYSEKEGEKVSGLRVYDLISNLEFDIHSKFVVNAAGPWVDQIRVLNHSKKGKHLRLTKGVHLVFDHKKLPVKQSVYFDVPDGRMIFAIPRGKITYVGTTDTYYEDDLNDVRVDLADAIYLISAVNNMFPSIHLELEDIQSSWAGLRPLIYEEEKSPSELSRKDEIFVSDTGLISIAGGKLTGYRKMSERVVNRVAENLEEHFGLMFGKCQTQDLILIGGHFKNYKEVIKYTKEVKNRLVEIGLSSYEAWYLVSNYGKQTEIILERFQTIKNESPEVALALSEYSYGLRYELVYTPLDFFIRRTGRMYFDIESIRELMDPILKFHQEEFRADEHQMRTYKEEIEAAILSHSNFVIESSNKV